MTMPERPRLLLVDDEPGILDLLEAVLTEAGYAVERAGAAGPALRILEAAPQSVRGLITDVRLPGAMDGWELARRARELSPDIAVVYVTGDSEASWASSGVPSSLLATKPFAPAQIVTAISSLLTVGGAGG